MIINCKNCNTNYLVTDDSIGINGRNVKCAKCNNVWFQEGREILNTDNSLSQGGSSIDENTDIIKNQPADDIEFNDKHVPVVIDRKIPILLSISLIVIVILNVISAIIFYSDKISALIPGFARSNFYIELYDEDLKVKDLKINKAHNQTNLDYSITNNSKEIKHIDRIIVRVLDKDKNLINLYKIEDKIEIKASEDYKVSNALPIISSKANFVSVKIKGNIFD